MEARTGRDKQRYVDGVRQVAGCVPLRMKNDGIIEVLLIQSLQRGDWILPKGFIL
jgi:hypothetical protein